jgi:hypothetical protein
MFSRPKLAFAGLLALALCVLALMVPATASANNFNCQLQSYAPNCNTGWGQRIGNCCDFYVYNQSGAGAVIYCHSYHTDGSNAGDSGYVYAGQTRYFSSYGYSKMTCTATSGPYPFWVSIVTNV